MRDKFEVECAVVARLLDELKMAGLLSDPNKTYGHETGADIEVRLTDRRIGVQVTVYQGAERDDGGGSTLRAEEERDAAKGITRTHAVPIDASGGLAHRFNDKLAKASTYAFEEFDEVWLLVAAFLPMVGAVAATSLLPVFITTEWLEQQFGERLRSSKYRRAFLHVHLWAALYEWSLETGWRVVRAPEKLMPPGPDGQLWFKQYLDDPELRRDPRAWALREGKRVLDELRSGVNSTSDRTPDDGGQRRRYVMRTGRPRWSVGCLQDGPEHDAGLRWFVLDRGPGGPDWHTLAYTKGGEEAETIVAALEQAEGDS